MKLIFLSLFFLVSTTFTGGIDDITTNTNAKSAPVCAKSKVSMVASQFIHQDGTHLGIDLPIGIQPFVFDVFEDRLMDHTQSNTFAIDIIAANVVEGFYVLSTLDDAYIQCTPSRSDAFASPSSLGTRNKNYNIIKTRAVERDGMISHFTDIPLEVD